MSTSQLKIRRERRRVIYGDRLLTPLLVNRDAQAHQPLPCSCVLRGFLRHARPLRDDRLSRLHVAFQQGVVRVPGPGSLEYFHSTILRDC